MSYDIEKIKVDREAFQIVEIDLDECLFEYADDDVIDTSVANFVYDSEATEGSSWTETNVTVLDNIADNSGRKRTASLLTGTATAAAHYLLQSLQEQFQWGKANSENYWSFSVEFKRCEGTKYISMQVETIGVVDKMQVHCNLDTGNVWGTNYNAGAYDALPNEGASCRSEDMGDGWWRVILENVYTDTGASGGSFAVFIPDQTVTSESGYLAWHVTDATDLNIFVTKLQAHSGATIKDYVPLIAGQAGEAWANKWKQGAFMNRGCGLNKENRLWYATDFSHARWLSTYITRTEDFASDPWGYINACQIMETVDNSIHGIYQSLTDALDYYSIPDDQIVSMAVSVKSDGTRSYSALRMQTKAAGEIYVAVIRLSDGVITDEDFPVGVTVRSEDMGDGWYRLIAEGIDMSSGVNGLIEVASSSGANVADISYAG